MQPPELIAEDRDLITALALPDRKLENANVCLFIHPPVHYSLGIIPVGGRKEVDYWLENPIARPIEIDQFEIHCACLTFTPQRLTIEPGQKVQLRATVDFKGDDRDHNLAIDVKGLTKSGDVVLKMVVHVKATGNRQQAAGNRSRKAESRRQQ